MTNASEDRMVTEEQNSAETTTVALNPFASWVQEQRGGLLHSELSEELAKVVAKVIELGKTGTLQIQIAIAPSKVRGAVEISDKIVAKPPEPMVFALDPGHPPPDATQWPMPADPGAPRPLKLLAPADAVVQFHVGNDEHATEIVCLAANACTTGHLIPDSDHAGSWQAAIATTAEHYRAGLHG